MGPAVSEQLTSSLQLAASLEESLVMLIPSISLAVALFLAGIGKKSPLSSVPHPDLGCGVLQN